MSFLTYYLISVILILIAGIIYEKIFEEMPRENIFCLLVAIGFALIPCLNNVLTVSLIWQMIKELPDLIYGKILDKVMRDIKEKNEGHTHT